MSQSTEQRPGGIDTAPRDGPNTLDSAVSSAAIREDVGVSILAPRELASIGEILEAALARCRLDLEERQTTVSVTLPEEVHPIPCDREGMIQVAACLLETLARRIPAGGHINAIAGDLRVGMALMVSGMSLDGEPRCLNRSRGHGSEGATTQRECACVSDPSGGLSAARMIMERQGGTLFAVNEGQGSLREFVAYLPRASHALHDARLEGVRS